MINKDADGYSMKINQKFESESTIWKNGLHWANTRGE